MVAHSFRSITASVARAWGIPRATVPRPGRILATPYGQGLTASASTVITPLYEQTQTSCVTAL